MTNQYPQNGVFFYQTVFFSISIDNFYVTKLFCLSAFSTVKKISIHTYIYMEKISNITKSAPAVLDLKVRNGTKFED